MTKNEKKSCRADIFCGVPEPMKTYEEEKEFVHAVCECPVPNTYSIRIPRSFCNHNGVYSFRCINCGIEGVLITQKRYLNNEEMKGVVAIV